MSISGRKLAPNQNPVTCHPAALKQPVLLRSIPVKGAVECVSAHTQSCLTRCWKNPTCTSLNHQIHSQVSYYTSAKDISKARMSIGSFEFCSRCCRVCNGGGRSVPRDEGISWNQEAVGLAEGYFLVKRFLNCRGDQRRWLLAPKAVCSDKHPAKCAEEQGGHGWINVICEGFFFFLAIHVWSKRKNDAV